MDDIKEAQGIDLIQEYESLIEEKAIKPKTFEKDKSKVDRLEIVYNEVFRRIWAFRD
jgi:hypothetical protein